MIRDFSREELEPPASSHTELTLGLGTVLGLGAGLLLICIVCFALGYAVGHRSSSGEDSAVVVPDANSATPRAKAGAKPGAIRQAANSPSPGAGVGGSDGQLATAGQSGASAATGPAQSDAPLRIQPATSQVQGWMVQIAAVSRSEDADVLVSALRKRGYAVSERRELGDNLIHVQTGPFASRNDANTMRQKLLNDGYNAIVQ